mmetsp:Transcript_43965/g.140916  ORF Transcript_43965/g.140916 Transcript_43965/m.140916 type:complete len:112 (-) Transcript_43965:14-349(-)
MTGHSTRSSTTDSANRCLDDDLAWTRDMRRPSQAICIDGNAGRTACRTKSDWWPWFQDATSALLASFCRPAGLARHRVANVVSKRIDIVTVSSRELSPVGDNRALRRQHAL